MRKLRLFGTVPPGSGPITRSRAERRALTQFDRRRRTTWQRKWAALRYQLKGTRTPGALGRSYRTRWNRAIAAMMARGLGATGNMRAVCRSMGMSSPTPYRRRKSDPFFAYAWDEARDQRYDEIEQMLVRIALEGWDEPVWHEGVYVGQRHRVDPRLGLRLLQQRLQRGKARLAARRGPFHPDWEEMEELDASSLNEAARPAPVAGLPKALRNFG